jgi:hypothetical protein
MDNAQPFDLGQPGLDPQRDASNDTPPEPTGPPAPSPVLNGIAWAINGTLLAVAAGAFVAPVLVSVGHTTGATRSARIEWERRDQEIAAAENATASDTDSETTGSTDSHDRLD